MNPWIPIINSIGLIFDIIGAFMVAFEVVRQFRGSKFDPMSSEVAALKDDRPVLESKEKRDHDLRKYKWMKRGLVFLVLGFILQGISGWIPWMK